jgi:hypothetical protein
MGEKRKVYRLLIGKPEGKGPLGTQGLNEYITLKWILLR